MLLLNVGRLLMLFIWGFLLLNIVYPLFPKPSKYFLEISLLFIIIMHTLQLTLLHATQSHGSATLTKLAQIKFFFFGVFELLVWNKQNKLKQHNVQRKK